LIGPEKRKKKAIRTARCLSAASFGLFRFFLSIAGIGQSSGSPFLWLLSFGEAKESDCPRGISGMLGVHPRPSPLTPTLSREGRGDYAALRAVYVLDSCCARMTAGWGEGTERWFAGPKSINNFSVKRPFYLGKRTI
jgi:hypothetical protein